MPELTTQDRKQSRWRGKNEERTCARMVQGVVVGRSKAVKVGSKWIQTNCQQPPDVLTEIYAIEVTNRNLPKSVADKMNQAIRNCPQGLTPKLWWRDRRDGVRYLIELLPDFLGDHIGKR